MSQVQISVIILTHKLNPKLIEAIKSAQFANQVLLINTTPNQKFKSKINKNNKNLQFEEINLAHTTNSIDFSKIRNQALLFAKNEWIFFLDSDEIISSKSISEIKQIIQSTHDSIVLVKRHDYFLNKKMNHGEVGKVRILRMSKKSIMKFYRPVHEIIKPTDNNIESNIIIKHYPHNSTSSFIDKISLYSKIEAKYRLSQKNKFSFIEMMFFPITKFIHNFIIKKGFKDGWRGLIYATNMSLHSFFVRVWMYELLNQNNV